MREDARWRHFFSMNLLRRNKRHSREAMFAPDLPMNSVEPRQGFRLVVGHLDARHPQREPMDHARQRTYSRELLSRKLTAAHLGEIVVRVVVVVDRMTAGCRLPARLSSSGLGFGAGVGLASDFTFSRVIGSSSSFA